MSCYFTDLFCQAATMGLSASEEVTMVNEYALRIIHGGTGIYTGWWGFQNVIIDAGVASALTG